MGHGVETGLTVPDASQPVRRRWYHRRDLRFVMVVAAILAAYYGYAFATGSGRITDRLHARLAEYPKRVNINVTTKFPPEAFHIGIYQRYGGMRGTRGSTATIFRVRPSDIRRLSRKYWIERIELAR